MDRCADIVQGNRKSNLCYLAGGCVAAGLVANKIWASYTARKRDAKRFAIRKDRDAKIAALTTKITNLQLERDWAIKITKTPLVDLSNRMKSGDLLVVDVLHAYQLMALEAQEQTNCITNVFDDAEEIAKMLDGIEKEQRKGILFGIPISIKDNVNTRGHLNTYGTLTFCQNEQSVDQLLVEALRKEGAIPFVKTNLPQILMSLETANKIYGRTLNPHDKARTPGGSSGGEAALIAYGGSPLGLGSDIGGSIRNPCSFSGIAGLKPGSARVTMKGRNVHGQTVLRSSFGPMARDVDSLVLFMQAILNDTVFDNDSTVPPIPFNKSIYNSNKPMKIGFYLDDCFVAPSPTNVGAVMVARRVLEQQGHTLVPWTPPNIAKCVTNSLTAASGDRGISCKSMLTDDDIDPCISYVVNEFTMHPAKRRLCQWIAKLRGRPNEAALLHAAAGKSTVGEWFDFTAECMALYQDFQEQWMASGLDALICPAFVVPAAHHNESDFLIQCMNYNCIYNLLDVPAGVIPVTRVTSADIAATKYYEAEPHIRDFVHRTMEGAEGLPVGVQCVALRYQEELCLRVMKIIEDGM